MQLIKETTKRKTVRLVESGKWMFAIVGAAGYAGELASMKIFFVLISLLAMSGLWFAIYKSVELTNECDLCTTVSKVRRVQGDTRPDVAGESLLA